MKYNEAIEKLTSSGMFYIDLGLNRIQKVLENLGNPQEYTILDFAKLIIELTNSNSEIIFKELPSDDPVQRKPNISLAKEKLNWEPSTSVKDGLLNTINYFKEII